MSPDFDLAADKLLASKKNRDLLESYEEREAAAVRRGGAAMCWLSRVSLRALHGQCAGPCVPRRPSAKLVALRHGRAAGGLCGLHHAAAYLTCKCWIRERTRASEQGILGAHRLQLAVTTRLLQVGYMRMINPNATVVAGPLTDPQVSCNKQPGVWRGGACLGRGKGAVAAGCLGWLGCCV